jgi:hypothetical protein
MNTTTQRIDFEPLMKAGNAEQIALYENDLMMERRLSLGVLNKSRTELEQMMTDSPVEITNMMEMVMTTTEQYKAITAVMEIAEARLISVVDAELVKLTGESALPC